MKSFEPNPISLRELARLLDAELRAAHPDQPIRAVAGIETAGPEDLTFVANPRYAPLARTTAAGAVLVEPEFPEIAAATLRCPNPYLAFSRAIRLFSNPVEYAPGVHPTASVAETASVGDGAHIGAFAVVMDHVTIGPGAVLLPHVVIYPHVTVGARFFAHAHSVVREFCELGDDVTLQNGAVIGSDGFGFARDGSQPAGGSWSKIFQSAPAVLENNVEVQANACIDRASIGETRIGAGTKVDNLVQVGHGSTVGKDTLLCAQVGLAGSSRIGNRVILAGQVGVAGHCTIGDGVVATAQSGVPGDIEPGKIVSGYPAVENRQWLKSVAALNRLPHILRNLNAGKK